MKVYLEKNINLSTVKRKLEKMGLSRKSIVTQRTPDVEVEAAVQDEITGSGLNFGNSSVWASLRKKRYDCTLKCATTFVDTGCGGT